MSRIPKSAAFLCLFVFCLYRFLPAETQKVCIEDVCVKAEVAATELEQQRGLMERESLAQDQGMLFVFEEEKARAFWMKNMQLPLDIIWADAYKKIVDIHEKVPPCKESCPPIIPKAPAKFVLEVFSGFTEKNRIEVGDILEF